MASLLELAQNELNSRDDLSRTIYSVIERNYRIDPSFRCRKEKIQNLIYHELGFEGKPPYYFCSYFNLVLADYGFRSVRIHGYAYYTGFAERVT